MKSIRLLIIALLSACLISCETEIEFDGDDVASVLVLNCMACSDSTLEVKLTSSRFFLSSVDTFTVVSNATVAMYVNATFVENLVSEGQGIYRSVYRPAPGESVRLVASATGYTTVQSEEVFPALNAGFSIDTTFIKKDSSLWVESYYYGTDYGYEAHYDTIGVVHIETFKVAVRFTDPPGKNNYYRLVVFKDVFVDSTENNSYKSYYYGFEDVVFGTKNNGIFESSTDDPLNLFTDEFIDGQTHSIEFDVTSNDYHRTTGEVSELYNSMAYLHIELQPISKGYYLYMKTVEAFDNSNDFMSEPVQIYTNIENGLGLFSTRTRHSKRFRVKNIGFGSFF